MSYKSTEKGGGERCLWEIGLDLSQVLVTIGVIVHEFCPCLLFFIFSIDEDIAAKSTLLLFE